MEASAKFFQVNFLFFFSVCILQHITALIILITMRHGRKQNSDDYLREKNNLVGLLDIEDFNLIK